MHRGVNAHHDEREASHGAPRAIVDPWGRVAFAVEGLAVAVAMSGVAFAQGDRESIGIAYDAPAGCPAEATFLREVAGRMSRTSTGGPGERARTLHVVVSRRGPGFTGKLWIEEKGTSSTPRAVTGPACADVVSALSLIAAVAVESKAAATAAQNPETTLAPEGTSGVSNTESAPTEAAGTPQNTVQPNREPIAKPPARGLATSASSAPDAMGGNLPARDQEVRSKPSPAQTLVSARPVRLEAGAQIELSSLADLVVAGRVFGELEIDGFAEIWAPSFRLALARSLDNDRHPSVGSATLTFTEASLEACPVRANIAASVAVRPCAGASGGVLQAQGKGVDGAQLHTVPWATVFAHGRLAWRPLRLLAVEADVGALAPLRRDSFVFDPNVPVYRAPPLAIAARLGFGMRFP
jgi:hypothetical protein